MSTPIVAKLTTENNFICKSHFAYHCHIDISAVFSSQYGVVNLCDVRYNCVFRVVMQAGKAHYCE